MIFRYNLYFFFFGPYLQTCKLKQIDLGQKRRFEKSTKKGKVSSLACECNLTITAVKNNLNDGHT